MRAVLVLLCLWPALACGPTHRDDGTIDGGPPGVVAPPPPSGGFPAEFLDGLPRNDAGLPILMALPGIEPGSEVRIVIAPREDAVTAWGRCLERVLACVQGNEGDAFTDCLDLVACDGASTDPHCCPPACIDAYKEARAGGADEPSALDATFLRGACVPGFDEQLTTAGVAR